MKQKSKNCSYCNQEFIPERRNAMYCSPTCRQYSYLKRKTGESPHERVKEKESMNQQLQTLPALVIEGEEKIHEIINAPAIPDAEIPQLEKKKENPAPDKIDSSAKPRKNYSDEYLEKEIQEEKKALIQLLNQWWKNNNENINLIVVNRNMKKFIHLILHFHNQKITDMQVKKFLIELLEFRQMPEYRECAFTPYILASDDMLATMKNFLVEMQLRNSPSLFFKLSILEKTSYEIILLGIEEFEIQPLNIEQ